MGNRRPLVRVDGLHEIDLDAGGTLADARDVLVDVLALAHVASGDGEAQKVDPQLAQLGFVGRPDGDLLQSEDPERSPHGSLGATRGVHVTASAAWATFDASPVRPERQGAGV